ncbi:DUF2267 domain-containing protein, partial [Streptomyces sp. NPDC001156]
RKELPSSQVTRHFFIFPSVIHRHRSVDRGLAGVLPAEIAPPLVPPEDVAQKFGVAEFVRRVSERAGADEAVARRGVAAVFMTLGEAVPDTEFQDVMSQLPNEFQNI